MILTNPVIRNPTRLREKYQEPRKIDFCFRMVIISGAFSEVGPSLGVLANSLKQLDLSRDTMLGLFSTTVIDIAD
jgi:hypothetical protein